MEILCATQISVGHRRAAGLRLVNVARRGSTRILCGFRAEGFGFVISGLGVRVWDLGFGFI